MNGKNELLTREAILKEEFNSRTLDTKSLSQFLMYFVLILQTGVEKNVITEEKRDKIAEYITSAIDRVTAALYDAQSEFVENEVQIANYLYVVTLYLRANSKWDAFVKLNAIESIEDAIKFLNVAKDWLNRQLFVQQTHLELIKKSVAHIDKENITISYNELKAFIKKFRNFDTRSCADFRALHKINVCTRYVFINDSDGTNFFEKLCKTIYSFYMEVSIMAKLNTKELINKKEMEAEEFYFSQKNEIDAINKKFESQISNLRNKKELELSNYYDKLHQKPREGEEILDDIVIRDKYSSLISQKEEEWNKEIELAEKRQSDANFSQLEIVWGEYCLNDLLKEYAIFSLSERGVITYPSTSEERGMMLASLKRDVAIDEFVRCNRDKLDDLQIEFLENCK